MSLESTVLATRCKVGPLYAWWSFCGCCYRVGEKIKTVLLDPADQNISLELKREETPSGIVIFQLCHSFVGQFLSKLVRVGQEDCQIFRFHWCEYDNILPRDEWQSFGDLIAELPSNSGKATTQMFVERLWGPQWENQDLLVRWGDLKGPASATAGNELFMPCPIKLVDVSQANIWRFHPGLVADEDEDAILRVIAQMRSLNQKQPTLLM
jgi:hypothetical protein